MGCETEGREQVLDWHRDLQELLSGVISVGRRIQTGRKPAVELIDDLFPVVLRLEAETNTMPVASRLMVESEVQKQIRVASGMAYHLAHLPQPEQESDSVAGVMYHMYEMLDLLGFDTNVEVRKVIEVIGDFDEPDKLGVTKKEAERVLSEFEKESKRQMDEWNEMTVDELMELPWEKVDEVFDESDREKLVEYCVETYYEKALIEKPLRAKSALEESERELFG